MECTVCERRCDISADKYGYCGMYRLQDGRVVPRFENQVSSISIGRIEDVPMVHYYPGSLTLLSGTVGCNFDCKYCSNSKIARGSFENIFRYQITPQELVLKAKASGCQNIAFNANEPAVSFDYFLEVAAEARAQGLRVGCASNGYFTETAIHKLAQCIDFINISLKSASDKYYQEMCQVSSVDPVIRNIRYLVQKGVHVEITTPVVPQMKIDEAVSMAKTIGAISRDIPWHLFWLLPEYKMEECQFTSVEFLVDIRKAASKYLDYVFIGNLVASDWLNTHCPQCNTSLIQRVNASGCGSQLSGYRIKDGKCPTCGFVTPIVGDLSLQFQEGDKVVSCNFEDTLTSDNQRIGLLDAHGYQKIFNFKTGNKIEVESPLINEVSRLIHRRPYPGDEKPESDIWVTEMALDMLKIYPADLVLLNYAQAWFTSINEPALQEQAFKNTFAAVDSFISSSGFTPIILGLGGLEDITHTLELESLFGPQTGFIASGGNIAFISCKDLSDISPTGLKELQKHSRIFTKSEYLATIKNGYSAEFADRVGDYIAIANPGVVFKGLSPMHRNSTLTSSLDKEIPIYTPLPTPKSIDKVIEVAHQAVQQGQKVAIIMVEGSGFKNFPYPAKKCLNSDGEFVYQMHDQYFTLGTGTPYISSSVQFPFSKSYFLNDYRAYPFSGRFHGTMENTPVQRFKDYKTLTTGNRNIATHLFLESDISIECCACYLHNFGTMTVFHEKAFELDKKCIGGAK